MIELGSSGSSASITQSMRRCPRTGWRCLGVAERMRVPSPPAMTIAAILRAISVCLELGREGSNLRSRDQNPLPYHLATPHSFVA